MFKPTRLMIAATVGAMALAGCETLPTQSASVSAPAAATGTAGCKPLPGTASAAPVKEAAIGAAIGAVTGALIGRNAADKKSVGTRNGALFGALAGALAGTAYAKTVGVTESADGSVKLDVPGSVLFPSGSFQLDQAFKQTLDSVAGTIKEYCGVTARVVGHTDNTGRPESNQLLSQNRAQAVTTYLASRGVEPNRLSSAGVADTQPVASNADAAGRQQNRRVEIFVQPPAP